MVEHSKRKKHHDKDKYYKLAKEQGYRSRAAFKLIQINRKYHFLDNAKIVLDLCAAPGGWTQVCSRTMNHAASSSSRALAQSGSIILAVDILPIRSIGPNVLTLIGDITTEKTKSQIKQQLQNTSADVVLCDGAPDVGASYDRDAYMQNEIALHALKCATQHLRKNGTFVTKIYRSSDYSAYLWVIKQFFQQVQVVKPSASRSQSAEIFLVCLGYLQPTSIDPLMFDPKCVFEQVDGAATGGGDISQAEGVLGGNSASGITIFHKKYDEKRRSRQGYDMNTVDFAMRNVGSVSDFIECNGVGLTSHGVRKDPIHMLSFCTGLSFYCPSCSDRTTAPSNMTTTCNCQFYLHHKLTTSEIKTCLTDLKVLNKSDFKSLLTWRLKMQEAIQDAAKTGPTSVDADNDADSESKEASSVKDDDDMEDEDRIQSEIALLRQKKLRQQKKQKKKERELMSKRRKRAALGMDLNAVDVPDNDKIFSLATITSKGDLELAREVDLSKVTDDQLLIDESEEEDGIYHDTAPTVGIPTNDNSTSLEDEITDQVHEYSFQLERDLDEAYDRYLATTKNRDVKKGTQSAKRSKKVMLQKVSMEAHEDAEILASGMDRIDQDTLAYAQILQGKKDSDDDDTINEETKEGDNSDDDGFYATPVTPDEHNNTAKQKQSNKNVTKNKTTGKADSGNPLIYALPEEPTLVKTARWFSNPLFESISSTAALASLSRKTHSVNMKEASQERYSDKDTSDNSIDDEDRTPAKRKQRSKRKIEPIDENKGDGDNLTADKVLALIPKTDKQVRHEKRLKMMERKERRAEKRMRLNDEKGGDDFEVVRMSSNNHSNDDKVQHLNEQEKERMMEARALIKAGFGKNATEGESDGFQVVPLASHPDLPVVDERKYDSDHENYDSDDYATTLALGTMMLRKSKAKALVDASYNRYAWNDPHGLPEWFVDDEKRHYRPQLPIPPDLLEKMKQKFLNLAAKPIAKVAEARLRKRKRVKTKLAAAKKKAAAVANSTDLTETMKLKAISKALRGEESTSQKKYVVSKKNGSVKGGKGIKLVDKRMKSDKRGIERASRKMKGKRRVGKR